MRKLLLSIMLLLAAVGAFAQTTVFWTDRALGVNPFQGGVSSNTPTFISYGWVRVCGPISTISSGSPCTPVAAITDINGNPLSIQGGNFGQLQTDVVGRFSFGCTPGIYQIQVAPTSSNTPQLNYPITCPSGTVALLSSNNIWTGIQTFNLVNKFNNVLYIGENLNVGGSADIGSQFNAAYASCPAGGCHIYIIPKIDGSCYTYTVPMVATTSGKLVLLEGMGTSGLTNLTTDSGCINFTPGSGTAITMDFVPSSGRTRSASYGITNLKIINNVCTTIGGCGGTAVGISTGNTNSGLDGAVMDRVTITGFANAFVDNVSPALNTTWIVPHILNNTTGFRLGKSAFESVLGGNFYGNGEHIVCDTTDSRPELKFSHTQFIAHGTEAIDCTATTGNPASLTMDGAHFENGGTTSGNAHFIEGDIDVHGTGTFAEDDNSTGCGPSDWWFKPSGFTWTMEDVRFVTGTCDPSISILNLTTTTRAKLDGVIVNPAALTHIVAGTGTSRATVWMANGAATGSAPNLPLNYIYESTVQSPSFLSNPVTFATLPTCNGTTEGTTQAVTNSNTAVWGANIAGGGANHVLAYCDGTSWTVAAK